MPSILACGRLTPQKGFPTLIHAFALLRFPEPSTLTILGEGEQRADLEELAETLGVRDRVYLPGFTGNPYHHMQACDVFVLSSLWEGLPNVLIEAMACGASVVATDCAGNGPREILEDGQWGVLVPPGNPEALAFGIQEAWKYPTDATPRAAAFTLDKAVNAYLDVLGG